MESEDRSGNRSPQSDVASVGTPPAPDTEAPSVPSGLQGTATSTTAISLTCNASTDNTAVVGYRFFRNGTDIGTSPTCSYGDTGLAPDTSYGYAASAYDAAGNQSAQSESVSVKTASAGDTTPPSVPTGLSCLATGATTTSCSWNASTDNVGVTGYNVYQNGTATATVTARTFGGSGLTPSTPYAYAITALDAAGNESAKSAAVTVTTQAAIVDTDPPFMSSEIHLSLTGPKSVLVTWGAGSDGPFGSGIAGYHVYRRDSTATPGGSFTQIATVTSGLSYADNDPAIIDGHFYHYQVDTFDNAGNVSADKATLGIQVPLIWYPGPYTIDLMVYLNQDVTETNLNQLVATANQAYTDRGINLQLRLVHVEPVNYPATTPSDYALYELQGSQGAFANMSSLRSQDGADLVLFVRLIYSEQGYCGVALIGGSNGTLFKTADMFSVVSTGTNPTLGYLCTDDAFPHELGHNMGNKHNLEVSPGNTGVKPYANGYSTSWGNPSDVGDTMSYSGFRYLLFSSPNLTVKDGSGATVPLGIADVADASRSMREVGYLLQALVPKKVK